MTNVEEGTRHDLRIRRLAARVSIAGRRRQKLPVPQQLIDFADGKADEPGISAPAGWMLPSPGMTQRERSELRTMNVRRAAARVSIAGRRRQKLSVPQQLIDFADGKVDDPGPF
ncbi:hypothetical protein [Tsukamurella spumae]|uniref:Uncharacterized protein n=1 Tax=Tsukamurella spumae TaxID=44753 RepID=A0A846WVX0_9ACTN|nr:hypothetical protein [Tsukamurella spumae]NKY17081.1 hypothetical protein [Tsukamurella spumae]